MAPVFKSVGEIIDQYTGQSRKVLEYSLLMKRLVDAAKAPGFSQASWDPLKTIIEVEGFERIGNFKEVMTWQDYVDFLSSWATSSEWDCSFKRISEVGSVVFLELEERSRIGSFQSVVNSLSVYEFNGAGKVNHIAVYLQMELPDPEMLKSYDGML
ncbi:MAG: hypothetical protein QM709_13025 [Spongiibacteraceae bacterium]